MDLDDDVAPVGERDAVHAAAARIEEVVPRDAGAEMLDTPRIDRRRERFGIGGAEHGALQRQIIPAPLGESGCDHFAEHRSGNRRRRGVRLRLGRRELERRRNDDAHAAAEGERDERAVERRARGSTGAESGTTRSRRSIRLR